ncbi:MAG: FliM/FliN family flagellar motor C-terminal domain-containing protein [Paracoccaceae bacterium]
MPAASTTTLLGRKIAAGRPAPDPAVMTAERAFHIAFARAGERQMNLPLRVVALAEQALSGPEIAEVVPEQALLLLLHGPGDGMGLAAFAPTALAALIEMLTLGRVADHPPPPRRPTRTDAALVCAFADHLLAECEALLDATEDRIWIGGFRFGTHLPDPRPLGVMLEEPAYRVFRLTLAFGLPRGPEAEVRTGEAMLAFPATGRSQPPAPPPPGDGDARAREEADAGWRTALQRVVLSADADVRAVLARVTLPLADLLKIETGQSLPLPPGALGAVQLEGSDGRLICLGQLGQGQGHRAVRLAPEEDGAAPVPRPVRAGELLPSHLQPLQPGGRLHGLSPSQPGAPPAGPSPASVEPQVAALARARTK